MRPLRLTMQAFGPYAGREVVDFKAALESGLFGIYGPTGSGKSSIFSAMSFALFGVSAKGDQDPSTLRSDHARPDCLTEVELVFEIGADRYLIRRRPEQMKPTGRGDGETKERHSAWLFDVTGIALDDISDENSGKVLAERKTTDVEHELSRRLGYGPEQFRQIVLLPQGKFEVFLTAKTIDRLAILRELFDVSIYKRLAQKMKEDAKAAEEKILMDRRVCMGLLKQEDFETRESLTEGVAQAKIKQEESARAATEAQTKASAAEKLLTQATHTENAFAEDASAAEALRVLEAKSDEIKSNKSKLAGALIARNLVDIDKATETARKTAKSAEGEKNTAIVAHTNAKKASAAAAKALFQEQGKHGELKSLRERHGDLKRHRTTLEGAKGLRAATETAAGKAATAEKTYEAARKSYKGLVQLRADKTIALKAAEGTTAQQTRLSVQLRDVQQSLSTARNYERALKAVTDSQGAVANSAKDRTIKVRAFQAAQTALERAESALAGAQALHLAEKLASGEPCPVCGSHEHPAPAKGDANSAGLDQAFRDARSTLEKARGADAQANTLLAGLKATLSERQATFESFAKPEHSAVALESQEAELKRDLRELGPASDLGALRTALETLEEKIAKATEHGEAARTRRDDAKTKAAVAANALETALVSVPEELQDSTALETACEAVDADIRLREAALEAAIVAERKAREALIVAAKDEETASKSYEKANADIKAADKALQQRLADNGLTSAQYQAHKASISQIKALDATIETHTKSVAAAKDRADRAKAAVNGVPRPDIVGLTATRDAAAVARDLASGKAAQEKARADHLEALSKNITATLAQIEKAEAAYAPLGAIAAAFNGQNNARMELETFAIAAMFDRVLEAANLRLEPMTSGRYTLEREQDAGKGAGRRGLGIVVHDVHTGRARATSTLSGGETFMAALALALGLSDIVESVSGGIRLDAIFIDEGFGSLDTEALGQALQTLQDIVGQSRAVGLISHVELVQQAIPNGFLISKSTSGSHVTARGY